MKTRLPLFNPARSGAPGLIRDFCRMTVVLALLVGLAFGVSKLLVRIRSAPPAGSPLTIVAASGSASRPYFHSGQWLADARTLVSMVRYLMTTETGFQTNTTIVAVATNLRPFQVSAQFHGAPTSPS